MPDGLLWAYGVVRDGRAVGIHGVEGMQVAPVAVGPLAILAGRLPLSAGELQRRLEDPEHVAALARAHHAVLDAALRGGDVIPLRMGTVYESREAIRAVVAAEAARFERLLARLHGQTEWGVKGYLVPFAPPPAASGTEYLQRRLASRAHDDASADTAATLHDRLAAAASEAVLSPPRLRERAAPMVLNGAYLVRRGDGDAFAALVGRLARGETALELELTGPWPPYHFV
jgi:hypothetical protein